MLTAIDSLVTADRLATPGFLEHKDMTDQEALTCSADVGVRSGPDGRSQAIPCQMPAVAHVTYRDSERLLCAQHLETWTRHRPDAVVHRLDKEEQSSEDLDATAKSLGFTDADDLARLVGQVQMAGSPDAMAKFRQWQAEDGTKAGLLKTFPGLK